MTNNRIMKFVLDIDAEERVKRQIECDEYNTFQAVMMQGQNQKKVIAYINKTEKDIKRQRNALYRGWFR